MRCARRWGRGCLILGHHYQQDEVIALSDLRGDSYQLSRMAADSSDCRSIAFCGVHFMAETADILANRPEKLAERGGERVTVVLPDMAAGCSMADMAAIDQVESCWEELGEVIDTDDITPVTYINSAASLKAFCGRHGGIVCTSSNAAAVLEWAFERTSRVLFFPDQHLGRNTAKAMGIPLRADGRCGIRMPSRWAATRGRRLKTAKVLLWQGHCSVHQCFAPSTSMRFGRNIRASRSWCIRNARWKWSTRATCAAARARSFATVEEAPPGTKWAIGTELHLVNRLKHEHPEQEIHFLSPVVCMCATMYRIDLAHLVLGLENLAAGTPVNVIEVEPEIAHLRWWRWSECWR